MDDNLHSPQRRLIELRMEHADLDSLIDRAAEQMPLDDLALRRLKKRRLLLRDQIAQLEVDRRSAGTGLSAVRLTLAEAVAQAFGSGGALAAADPGYTERAVQQQFAQAVAAAIETARRLVAEAGTGVGKTFAYLVPLLLSGKRALVSTATKSLQDQLFLRDLPRLVDALGVPVRVALLKGRSSYLCLHRLQQARQGASGSCCPTASRCARCRASKPGRRRRAAATWPRSTASTTARR